VEALVMDAAFWRGKRVFLTGHTGFKGGWLAHWLHSVGAEVFGFALSPTTTPSLYDVTGLGNLISSTFGDIRDYEAMAAAYKKASPDIAIHMAAQPIVRDSYIDPVGTYSTNVMGTVHFLEIVRQNSGAKVALVVTSDKCYENQEWVWGYRENEPMGGYDPYSNSKGCTELVVSAYRKSFFSTPGSTAIASGRAGNVIGGGDWANHRLIPDFFRAIEAGKTLTIRYPKAVRPWQHVLVPLSGYVRLCEALWRDPAQFAGGWNFGPDFEKDHSVEDVLNILKKVWKGPVNWEVEKGEIPHEAINLRLDSSKARTYLDWVAAWSCKDAVVATAQWQQSYIDASDMRAVTMAQIEAFTQGRSPAASLGI
jgi:CDP-glucose 4,6-dehydratase